MKRPVILLLLAALLTGCSDKENPTKPAPPANDIIPLNGVRFKGHMGSSVFHLPMQFSLTDNNGASVPNQSIQTSLIEGDGSLPASITSNAQGVATLTYTFSGDLPYATARLIVPDIDTLDVFLRADAIHTGNNDHGQISYIRFSDTRADVRAWLGAPASEDFTADPQIRRIFMNYEAALGVVVMLWDLDKDNTFYDTSSVYGVIVNTTYDGTTIGPNPIGIGSTFAEMRARWGDPDTVTSGVLDTAEFSYSYHDLYGFAAPQGADTILTELQFSELPIRPDRIVPVHGLFYRGTTASLMTDSVTVEDIDGFRIQNVDLSLERLLGDGAFLGNGSNASTVRTDEGPGYGTYIYNFNGQLGHAVMRLTLPNIDTVDISLRRNTLIPGPTGQGQYVLFNETAADVRNWNGDPISTATDGPLGTNYIYARYNTLPAADLHIIFDDPGNSNALTDASGVHGVVAFGTYAGKTAQGIGVGSTWTQLTAAYPGPVVVQVGDTLRATYDALPARFDALITELSPGVFDTTVFRAIIREAP